MSAPTYRPGDIAMVSDKAAVRVERQLRSSTVVAAWRYLDDEWMPPLPESAVGPVLGNVADIAELRGILAEVDLTHLPVQLEEARAEVASLTRWKEEAMPVMDGLQELGKALRIPLGQRITGPAALEAVQQLQARAGKLEQERNLLRSILKDIRRLHHLWGTARESDDNYHHYMWRQMRDVLTRKEPEATE